ncbi:unnamed protein product [Rotaria sp. Silwood2]|nr:unnamed protein product [Rotaria sp. Silwood2]
MEVHLIVCATETVKCPKCQKFIQRGSFSYHVENQCADVDQYTIRSQFKAQSNQTPPKTHVIQQKNIENNHSEPISLSQPDSQLENHELPREPEVKNPLKEELDKLATELSEMKNKIEHPADDSEKLSMKSKFSDSIDKWRDNIHHRVDEYCKKKREEFTDLLDQETEKQKADINQLEARIIQLKEEQNLTQESIDSMKNSIKSFNERINQVVNVESTFSLLTIDDHLINISLDKSVFKYPFPLTKPYQEIKFQGNNGCIAVNDDHLVVIQSNMVCVYNRQWQILKAFQWPYGNLYNVLWSNVLGLFIFIAEKKLVIFNDKVMGLNSFPLAEKHNAIDFYSGACSGNSLFLITSSWSPSICEYILRPLVEFKQEHQLSVPFTSDEQVLHCAANNEILGIIVKNKKDEIRFDLCLTTTMQRYFTVQLDLTVRDHQIRCY